MLKREPLEVSSSLGACSTNKAKGSRDHRATQRGADRGQVHPDRSQDAPFPTSLHPTDL